MVVFRDRRRSRHAAPPALDAPAAPDRELESFLAAISPDVDVALSEQTGRFSAQVFQLRLPAMRIEQLRRLAEERGVAPASLAVDWVIERLDNEDQATGPLAMFTSLPEPAKDRERPLPFRGEPGRRRRRV